MPEKKTVGEFIGEDPRHYIRQELLVRVPHSTRVIDAISKAQERGATHLIVERDGGDRLLMLDSDEWMDTWRNLKPNSRKTIGEFAKKEGLQLAEVSLETRVNDVVWAKREDWDGMAVLKTDGVFRGLITQHEIGRDRLNRAIVPYRCIQNICIFFPPAVPTFCDKHGVAVVRFK